VIGGKRVLKQKKGSPGSNQDTTSSAISEKENKVIIEVKTQGISDH
jgi:hypothetical protein